MEALPISLTVRSDKLYGNKSFEVELRSPVTCLIGPNACGKSLVLRQLKALLADHFPKDRIRLLPAGRLSAIDVTRADTWGQGHFNPDSNTQGSSEMQARYFSAESMLGDLHTLVARTDVFIKVQERLSKLFGRQCNLDWEGGNLKAKIKRSNSQDNYNIVWEGSGLLHLISILTALYDDRVDVLLIDEPEVSLHPQLQSFVLREIFAASKNSKQLIVYTTHSPELVRINSVADLSDLVFFVDADTVPLRINAISPELKGKKWNH